MSKVITSPVARWQGSVTLSDPLNMPQAEAIDNVGLTYLEYEEGKRVSGTMIDIPRIRAILVCVEKWDLQNFPNPVTAETFPMSPKDDRRALVKWLWDEISQIYNGETAVPNE